jgi:hypothetical protein
MDLTEDSFLALARSSPWRWSTLHFTHRDGHGQVEAWVKRPGQLLVRELGRPDTYESGVPYTSSTLTVSNDPGFAPPEPEHRVPQDVRPELRPDGLVAERPSDRDVDYDDPMWGNFSWVAMLDPVELSHHVAVADLRSDEVGGRPVWRADLEALPGYDPRCGGNCCELLYSEAGLHADLPEPQQVPEAWRGRIYPEAYDVALDVATGVVVRCLPVGGAEDAPWLENDILEVDVDLDEVFAPYD